MRAKVTGLGIVLACLPARAAPPSLPSATKVGSSTSAPGQDRTCTPLPDDARVLSVVTSAMPELAPSEVLGRAILSEAAPFELASDAETRRALKAEEGLRERRERLAAARELLAAADRSFAELEDRAALDLVAEATPLLVASQPEPGALDLLARAHLLAGAIFVARGRLDAASARLRRALDLDPDIAPPANLRLLGALEAVRARERRRGWLELELSGTATSATVFLDGRRIGQAPGRFENIGEGRHVLRVSAPEHRSYVGTVLIEADRGAELDVALAPDAVQGRLGDLGPRLAAGGAVRRAQRKLTQRAEVTRTSIGVMVPSTRRDEQGRLPPAMIVDLEDAGRARIDPLTLDAAEAALRALASCTALPPHPAPALAPAPPLLGQGAPVLTAPGSELGAPSPWRRPWFWAVAAAASVGLVGGVAAAIGSSAAPERAEVRLIPRPLSVPP